MMNILVGIVVALATFNLNTAASDTHEEIFSAINELKYIYLLKCHKLKDLQQELSKVISDRYLQVANLTNEGIRFQFMVTKNRIENLIPETNNTKVDARKIRCVSRSIEKLEMKYRIAKKLNCLRGDLKPVTDARVTMNAAITFSNNTLMKLDEMILRCAVNGTANFEPCINEHFQTAINAYAEFDQQFGKSFEMAADLDVNLNDFDSLSDSIHFFFRHANTILDRARQCVADPDTVLAYNDHDLLPSYIYQNQPHSRNQNVEKGSAHLASLISIGHQKTGDNRLILSSTLGN